MKVSVCMIVRNEVSLLPTALASVKGLADEVVIVDTGSDDGTVAMAKALANIVITGWDRMHKGNARNAAITAANGDWIVILDADEQIADPGGVRRFLEGTDAKAVYIRLSFMGGGRPTLSYPQMRMWRKGTFEYKYRAHEVPVPLDGWPKLAHTAFVWEHRPTAGQKWKIQYNLDRLLLDVKENPNDARPLYYLGRQYYYGKEWEKALELLEKYIANPGIDAADALAVMARCHAGLGQEKERISKLFQACALMPQRREWWGELAEVYHAKGEDHVAVGLLKCALEQPPPPRSYVRHSWHGSHIHDLLARCLWKLERYQEGHIHALKAFNMSPGNSRLQTNLKWFQDALAGKKDIEKGPDYYDGIYKWQIEQGALHRSESLLKLVSNFTAGSILDLGCGPGFLADMISGRSYVGVDFSPFALECANRRCQNKAAKFLLGDICSGLALGRKFDTVVLAEVLEHLSQPKQAIYAAQAHAKERIIITVPVNMDDPAHAQPAWTPADLEALIGPLLSCEKVLGKYWLAVVEMKDENDA